MNTKEIVKKYNIRPTKSLGQNFLIDDGVIKRIAASADISRKDLVIEVGPGIGSLTRELAERAGKVVAVEIDRHLIPAFLDNMKDFPNVELIHEDILRVNAGEVVHKVRAGGEGDLRDVKVVGNLPYYITTPIIMKFLEENPGIKAMVFMVQKEVAERMVAKPGGKDYGALSVAVQYYSLPQRLFEVAPHCFIPQPDVYSSVIRLDILKTPPVALLDREIFFKTVKAAFGQRRKTLLNALHNSGIFTGDKESLKKALEDMGIDAGRRGETLTIEQFAQISNALSKKTVGL
ncbi:MAG: 16S rRNA (adenine(1518)-N(6)/adenine(1519)-N(6))-dimethyltransferase RsmA [Clostridiales bacterium]|jgi:16S rRNA (adenine1518-N6/adenine1519-N6)-dimethyltransferase|nr:16S rRNA (adenine(1518)-N(6)/adenine(1519)-N(6))-dimethyltransferase RsmA [Eubacteriales bacterium]MDH7566093.1 16S rRNA (adenine(1518)-N(6)/adenine(1519)-N(6))-dimethyltransferase RsmA [Clostridiales bacterium]